MSTFVDALAHREGSRWQIKTQGSCPLPRTTPNIAALTYAFCINVSADAERQLSFDNVMVVLSAVPSDKSIFAEAKTMLRVVR
jgi:hypothetical protein